LCHDATFHQSIGEHLHRPANASGGWFATADGHQLRLDLAVYDRGRGRLFPDLAIQCWDLTIPHEPTPDPGDCVQVHPQHLCDLTAGHPPVGAVSIA
jgi:hypothetical protein